MKLPAFRFLLGGWMLFATTLAAQPVALAESEAFQHTPEQLEELLGPIALYPDALIALILPAATVSSDVVLASRYLTAHPHVQTFDQQPWDESVRALARYREVVKWLDENLEWTREVGTAFVAQPANVMNAIQRLRARARAAGTLTDTPQHHVVVEGEDILIMPAQPHVIYIPRYDPAIVYHVRPAYSHSHYFSFGTGFATGSWLYYDFDWHRRVIWVGHPHQHWRHHRNWRQPLYPGRPGYVHDPRWRPWQPPPHAVRPVTPRSRQDWQRPQIAPPDGTRDPRHVHEPHRRNGGNSFAPTPSAPTVPASTPRIRSPRAPVAPTLDQPPATHVTSESHQQKNSRDRWTTEGNESPGRARPYWTTQTSPSHRERPSGGQGRSERPESGHPSTASAPHSVATLTAPPPAASAPSAAPSRPSLRQRDTSGGRRSHEP